MIVFFAYAGAILNPFLLFSIDYSERVVRFVNKDLILLTVRVAYISLRVIHVILIADTCFPLHTIYTVSRALYAFPIDFDVIVAAFA